jgi:hypothetical protein
VVSPPGASSTSFWRTTAPSDDSDTVTLRAA